MTRAATMKGEATRQHILEAALAAFRDRGFAETTMRDIAKAAGLSLGASYHYFDAKESIVAAYYDWMQDEHERRVGAQPLGTTLADRVKALMTAKVELLRSDRKILVALFATMADPDHPLSLFGPNTSELRERSIALFREAFADTELPDELAALAARAAWLAHLGVMLYFVHDRSKGQERTRVLVEGIGDFLGFAVPLAAMPPFRRFADQVADFARKLGAA